MEWRIAPHQAGRPATRNLVEAVDCPLFSGEVQALVDTLPGLPGGIILVSNEVAWGLLPMR